MAAYSIAGYAVGRFALLVAPPGKATLIFLAYNLFPAANYFVMFGLRDPVILAGTTMLFLGLGRYLIGHSRLSLNGEVLLGAAIMVMSRPELAVIFVPSIGLIGDVGGGAQVPRLRRQAHPAGAVRRRHSCCSCPQPTWPTWSP